MQSDISAPLHQVNAQAVQSPLRSSAVFAGSAMDLIRLTGDLLMLRHRQKADADAAVLQFGGRGRPRYSVRFGVPDAVAWLRKMVISGPRAGPELPSAKNSAQHRCVGGPFQGMLQRCF